MLLPLSALPDHQEGLLLSELAPIGARAAYRLLRDRTVAYHPVVARALGSVKAAVFLAQLTYWSDHEADAEGWIALTRSRIEDETALSRREQEQARADLLRLHIIEQELHGVPPVVNFRVSFRNLITLVGEGHFNWAESAQSSFSEKRLDTKEGRSSRRAPKAPPPDELFIASLVDRFGPVLGSEARVRRSVEKCQLGPAYAFSKDKRRSLELWLEDDADRRPVEKTQAPRSFEAPSRFDAVNAAAARLLEEAQ